MHLNINKNLWVFHKNKMVSCLFKKRCYSDIGVLKGLCYFLIWSSLLNVPRLNGGMDAPISLTKLGVSEGGSLLAYRGISF